MTTSFGFNPWHWMIGVVWDQGCQVLTFSIGPFGLIFDFE